MILGATRIRQMRLLDPIIERGKLGSVTHGLGYAGYDVRIEFDAKGETEIRPIQPGEFLLASTIECFRMHPRVVGVVHDKSSWARRGLAVQNTVIEPGWEGFLTLELTNHSHDPIYLRRGMGIAQVIFQWVDVPWWERIQGVRAYDGKYQHQERGPQRAR